MIDAQMIANVIEEAQKKSMTFDFPIYVMSNGSDLVICDVFNMTKGIYEEMGYWTACIFENGHKIDM